MGVLNRHVVVLLAVVLIPTLAQNLYNNVLDENDEDKKVPNYWPLRPPAIPLAVRNPYTNVWSTSSRDQALNSLSPRFVSLFQYILLCLNPSCHLTGTWAG